jgi:hypothetical protein
MYYCDSAAMAVLFLGAVPVRRGWLVQSTFAKRRADIHASLIPELVSASSATITKTRAIESKSNKMRSAVLSERKGLHRPNPKAEQEYR